MSTQDHQLPTDSLQAGRRLRARHFKARIFAWVCSATASVGIILLVVLLSDIFQDGFGWINNRVDSDPRMFMLLTQSDPAFLAQANEVDAGLDKQLQSKLKSKKRAAERDNREYTTADERQVWEDVLHARLTKDENYFAQFTMQPTTIQRMKVAWQIAGSVMGNYPSRHPSKAGFKAAIVGTIWLLLLTALLAIPLGVSAAVYLEEYARKSMLNRFVEINIANLAGVPSIVYGILGLAVFVRTMGFGRSVLAGAATMSLLILPVIIIATREALKAVPGTLRSSAFALGATRWQVTRHHVLPAALPGILTGVILAMSRALGETAPMIMIGALSYVAFLPKSPMDDFTVLPIQIYNWVAMPQDEFHMLAACGIIILLALLLAMNSLAVLIRYKAQKDLKW